MTPLPSQLPPEGSPERWPWLQRLRRADAVATAPWLEAVEQGSLPAASDLVAVLVEKLDGAGSARLLRWWLSLPVSSEPAVVAQRLELLDLIGRRRDPACAALLRAAIAERPSVALLPLLGHQRDSHDFACLEQLARQAGPSPLRRAALEGLAVGLSVWPQAALQQLLLELCNDLDGPLASQAVDLLARLPSAREGLEQVLGRPLDPVTEARARRRLASLPRCPLLLVVHGRAGGVIPEELQALARDLERRRRAPVRLQTLSGNVAPPDPAAPGQENVSAAAHPGAPAAAARQPCAPRHPGDRGGLAPPRPPAAASLPGGLAQLAGGARRRAGGAGGQPRPGLATAAAASPARAGRGRPLSGAPRAPLFSDLSSRSIHCD